MPKQSSHTVNEPHFWQGKLPVAFVFSVPGAREQSANRPVAGTTGENLSFALNHLQSELPKIFSSSDRYAYRITNAYNTPIAKSLGHESSEASDSQILNPENIARILRDIHGCNVVILCGIKAQLLAESIRSPGRAVVCVWHTSNQALSSKFNSAEVSSLPDSYSRRKLRATLWAKEVLNSLNNCDDIA